MCDLDSRENSRARLATIPAPNKVGKQAVRLGGFGEGTGDGAVEAWPGLLVDIDLCLFSTCSSSLLWAHAASPSSVPLGTRAAIANCLTVLLRPNLGIGLFATTMTVDFILIER